MRVAWITDPHLDKAPADRIEALVAETLRGRPELILLTGDISRAPTLAGHLQGLVQGLGKPLYFVLGNHDFYGGSIAAVRDLAPTIPGATYLPTMKGVVPLGPGCALIGVDGWGDGKNGVKAAKGALLNDAYHIEELRLAHLKGRYHAKLGQLGAVEGRLLAKRLQAALATGVGRIVIATHVPPFPEAAWFNGKAGDLHTNPYFTCKSTGDVLLQCALDHPAVRFTVLCGHSHGGGEARKCPNLKILTGAVRVGYPRPQPPLEFA